MLMRQPGLSLIFVSDDFEAHSSLRHSVYGTLYIAVTLITMMYTENIIKLL